MDEKTDLGADAAAVDGSMAASESVPARDRVICAGVGWCAFSHQHDNSTAAINAARVALEITLERIQDAHRAERESLNVTAYLYGLDAATRIVDDLIEELK